MVQPQEVPREIRVVAKLEIIVRADGRITVNGPLDQKMLCYGMLEAARDQVKDFKVEAPSVFLPKG